MTVTDVQWKALDEGADVSMEWEDPSDLPVGEVRELFVTLAKALRAHQLYDENNPVYQRFVSGLRNAFRDLWNSVDVLQLLVEEDRLTWVGESVYESDNRTDSLAFLFHKDGVRGISFHPGIEDGEVDRFLSALQRAKNVRTEGDDLLTILWDEDLQFFKHSYVDLLAEGVEIPDSSEIDISSFANVLEGELQAEETEDGEEEDDDAPSGEAAPPAEGTVNRDDFNPTLYALDAAELEQLREEVNGEMTRDLRNDVLLALFDRLEESERVERQMEILGILRTLLPNLLSQGALRPASQILDEVTKMKAAGTVLDPQGAGVVSGILDDLSAPEAVQELVRSFQDGSIPASVSDLSVFLAFLRASALGPLVRAAELMEERELRPVLQEAVRSIADRNHSAVFKLMDSPDPLVAAGAIRLAGRMKLAEAGPILSRLLRHGDDGVRLAVVESSVLLRTSTVTNALQSALEDPSREVRIAAVRGLATLDFRLAAPRFRDLLTGKAIKQADLTEKIAFFESYGDLQDEKAVPLLSELLNGRGFLGRKEPPEIRACAALALGRLRDPGAKSALEAALEENDPVIRSAVRRALRREPDAS